MNLRWLSLFLFFLLLPDRSFAFHEWVMHPSNISFYQAILAIVNFSVAVVSFGFIVPLYNKLTGLLRRVWLFFTIAFSILIALLMLTLLRGFGIVDLSFLFGIAELFMLIMLLAGLFTFRKFVLEVLAKKFSTNGKSKN